MTPHDDPSPSEESQEAAAAAIGSSGRSQPPPIPLVSEFRSCWRCQLLVPRQLASCPNCFATLQADLLNRQQPAASKESEFIPLFWFYLVYLVSSVIFGNILRHTARNVIEHSQSEQLLNIELLVFELLDSLVALGAWLWWIKVPPQKPVTLKTHVIAWSLAPFALVLLCTVNIAYHSMLRGILQIPEWLLYQPLESTGFWMMLLTSCIQPGIIEELFFRHLAQNTLVNSVGRHGAIWIAALMFGLCHIFVPLSMLYLIVAGAVFGYVRVFGGLPLAMLVHAAHNLIIYWVNVNWAVGS